MNLRITEAPDDIFDLMDKTWSPLVSAHYGNGNWTRLESNCRAMLRVMHNDELLYEGLSPSNAIAAYNKATLDA